MSDTNKEREACQVPLIDRLRNVPENARFQLDVGKYETSYWPVGALCHEAAAALAEPSAQVQGETPAPLRGEDGLVRYPPSVAQKPYGVIIKALAGLVTARRTDEQFDADVQPSDPVRAACITIQSALDEVMAHVPKVNIAAPMPQKGESDAG